MKVRDPQQLQAARIERGLSQRALAAAIGWHAHTHLGKLERGQKHSLDDAKAKLIAEHLGVNPNELFEDATT